MKLTLIQGNTLEELPRIESDSVDLAITSPPYWALRSYNCGPAELGLEPTMEAYLDNTMRWVKEVWRVLKPTGSFVLNMGDCFIGGGRGAKPGPASLDCNHAEVQRPSTLRGGIYKTKQLLSVSSFAYCRIVSETDFVCRGEHIWAKPNVPSPIRSRLKHSHEKLFWFVKDADQYYFDKMAWMKPVTSKIGGNDTIGRAFNEALPGAHLSDFSMYQNGKRPTNTDTIEHSWRIVPVGEKQNGFELAGKRVSEHVAPYPAKLIEPYLLSLCPPDGTVLDPFLGSGTTMRVAMENGRNCIGIELSEKAINYTKARMNWGGGINVDYEVRP